MRKANKKLISQEMDNLKATRILKYELMEREKSENSAFFNIKSVSGKEISELNNFLISTGYKRRYDKLGYFFEGCLNDQKLFIGSKAQMIIHYCRNFPDMPVCDEVKFSVQKSYVDKGLGFEKSEAAFDTAVDGFTKMFDK